MSDRVDAIQVIDRDQQHAAAYRMVHGYADGSHSEAIRESCEAMEVIRELIDVSRDIEKWWLAQGMNALPGAPACIFRLRAVLPRVGGSA